MAVTIRAQCDLGGGAAIEICTIVHKQMFGRFRGNYRNGTQGARFFYPPDAVHPVVTGCRRKGIRCIGRTIGSRCAIMSPKQESKICTKSATVLHSYHATKFYASGFTLIQHGIIIPANARYRIMVSLIGSGCRTRPDGSAVGSQIIVVDGGAGGVTVQRDPIANS